MKDNIAVFNRCIYIYKLLIGSIKILYVFMKYTAMSKTEIYACRKSRVIINHFFHIKILLVVFYDICNRNLSGWFNWLGNVLGKFLYRKNGCEKK